MHEDGNRERGVLGQVADDIGRRIVLPTGPPWRAWSAPVSRTLRAAASLRAIRLVR